jgi:hypothetical protein
MTARKINCSAKCPLAGMPRATLRGFLCQGAGEYGKTISTERVKRLRYCGIQNITGKTIKSLVCVVQECVTNNFNSAR